MKINFSNVHERHEKILIVASCPEAMRFRPIPGWTVIAVNSSIHITKEHTDYWFTLDPSESNIKIMNEKPYDAKYYAAVPDWFGTPAAEIRRLRQNAPEDIYYLQRMSGPREAKYLLSGLANERMKINTGNSAFGALNLAYHMNPKQIVILGVNGNRMQPKFDNRHCVGSLDHLPNLFASAVPQLTKRGIQVFNANVESQVTCFPKIDLDSLI